MSPSGDMSLLCNHLPDVSRTWGKFCARLFTETNLTTKLFANDSPNIAQVYFQISVKLLKVFLEMVSSMSFKGHLIRSMLAKIRRWANFAAIALLKI